VTGQAGCQVSGPPPGGTGAIVEGTPHPWRWQLVDGGQLAEI
jgi:hypothetical protein